VVLIDSRRAAVALPYDAALAGRVTLVVADQTPRRIRGLEGDRPFVSGTRSPSKEARPARGPHLSPSALPDRRDMEDGAGAGSRHRRFFRPKEKR
jgi:hypothetical protein